MLYLTCSDRFDTLADKLVVLPGPSTERVLAHPTRTAPPEETIAPVPDAVEAPTPDDPAADPALRA